MFAVILNILVNGFLLMLTLSFSLAVCSFGGSGGNHSWHISDNMLMLISYLSIVLITLFGITQLGQKFAQLLLSTRDITLNETEQLIPILDEVQQIIQDKIPNYKKCIIKLKIGNNNQQSMQAFGSNTIIISHLFLNTSTTNELKALFGREIGHLYYRHSLILLAFWYSSITTIIFMQLFKYYHRIQHNLVKLIKNTAPKALVIITIVLYLITLFFIPIIIMSWISKHILNTCGLYIKRKYEYIADKFAADLGYKQDLIAILTKIDILEVNNLQPKFAQLLSTQVDYATRINKLHAG